MSKKTVICILAFLCVFMIPVTVVQASDVIENNESGIQGLTNLKTLYAYDNNIKNIKPLKN